MQPWDPSPHQRCEGDGESQGMEFAILVEAGMRRMFGLECTHLIGIFGAGNEKKMPVVKMVGEFESMYGEDATNLRMRVISWSSPHRLQRSHHFLCGRSEEGIPGPCVLQGKNKKIQSSVNRQQARA